MATEDYRYIRPVNSNYGYTQPVNSNYGLLSSEEAVSRGLGGAAGLIGSYQPSPYPSFVPSQAKAPTQTPYINYTPNQPMAQITAPNYKLNTTAPNYQGLMGGDYEAFQQALTTPGEIAATRAYNQGQINLQNQMGGRGLYGSSIMSNQARTALEQPYMESLATNAANAAAQRYGMQAADLQNANQFGLNVYGQQMGQEQAMNQYGLNQAQLGMQQNQNVYAASAQDAARQQDFNLSAQQYATQQAEAQRQWENQQQLEQFQYNLAAGQYGNQQNEAMINQYLALAGRGAPLQQSNQQMAAQQAQADAAQQAALYSGLGGLLTTGGLLYGANEGWF